MIIELTVINLSNSYKEVLSRKQLLYDWRLMNQFADETDHKSCVHTEQQK